MRWLNLSLILVTVLSITGCELTNSEQDKLDEVVGEMPEIGPGTPERPELGLYCKYEIHQQPEAEVNNKIDLLFVVDTSGSLRDEWASVGDGIDTFLSALPSGTDVNIGVMLAHVGSRAGKLYRRYPYYPYVLRTKDIAIPNLRAIMRDRLTRMPNQRESDGGEMGLYSLQQALAPTNMARIRSQGLLRQDAALAVVFLADENDICAQHPEGVTPVPDPDNLEAPAFEKYCGDVSAKRLSENLTQIMDRRPLLVSGILYNGLTDIPAGQENGVGYGYLDLIDRTNGVSIDLTGKRFHDGLAQIGTLTTKKLNLITEFSLPKSGFLPETIYVDVDGKEVPFVYHSEHHQIQLTGYAGRENSEVYISYCITGNSSETPAHISNIEVSSIGVSTVDINWATDISARSQVRVRNLHTDEVSYTPISTSYSTNHAAAISGLDANTLYELVPLAETSAGLAAGEPVKVRTRR